MSCRLGVGGVGGGSGGGGDNSGDTRIYLSFTPVAEEGLEHAGSRNGINHDKGWVAGECGVKDGGEDGDLRNEEALESNANRVPEGSTHSNASLVDLSLNNDTYDVHSDCDVTQSIHHNGGDMLNMRDGLESGTISTTHGFLYFYSDFIPVPLSLPLSIGTWVLT